MNAEMVGLIYAAIEDATLWKVFLQRFVDDLHCNLGMLSIVFPRHHLLSAGGVVGVSETDYQEYVNGRWKGEDPWVKRWPPEVLPAGTIKSSQNMCSDEELEQSDVYQHFLKQRGLHYGGGVILGQSRWQTSTMTVLRPKERGPLTEPEISYWRTYVPHLLRAVRIMEERVRLQSERDLLRGMAEDVHAGVLLVNSSREILFANQRAERMLQAGRGIVREEGGLRAESRADEKRFEDMFLRVLGNSEEGWTQRMKVSRGPDVPPLMLMAWKSRVEDEESPAEQPVILRLIDPDHRAVLDESALRELFLLTRAEAHLACELASGATVEQAAETAGVSVNTMRTHLARTFEKTGTSRQSQLVSLVLLTVPKRLG